jgi:ABC-type phosphate transport system substrate-binding protein
MVRVKTIACVVLALTVPAAAAQVLRGGGATAPLLAYTGDTSLVLQTPGTGSLLGAYTAAGNPALTYCPTGTGTGKQILEGDPSHPVNNPCLGTPSGFGSTGLTQPHFVASDLPLTTTDYATYQANRGGTKSPVQFPSLVTSIAISFNQPHVTSLRLTEVQVCRIFSGQINQWTDPQLASALTVMPGMAPPTGPITIVYRSEANGTSYNFTNHLSAMCGAQHLNVANQFKTDAAFATAAASYLSSYGRSVAVAGDANAVNYILGNIGAIGFTDATDSVLAGADVAKVVNVSNGVAYDPMDVGNPMPVNITWDVVMGTSGWVPVVPATGCIGVVDPTTYATPASGYPILGVSYLTGSGQDNGAVALNGVRTLFYAPWNPAIRAATASVGPGTGSAFLVSTAITMTRMDTCVN